MYSTKRLIKQTSAAFFAIGILVMFAGWTRAIHVDVRHGPAHSENFFHPMAFDQRVPVPDPTPPDPWSTVFDHAPFPRDPTPVVPWPAYHRVPITSQGPHAQPRSMNPAPEDYPIGAARFQLARRPAPCISTWIDDLRVAGRFDAFPMSSPRYGHSFRPAFLRSHVTSGPTCPG